MSDRAMSAAADAGPVGICRAPFAALSIDPAADHSSGLPAIACPGTDLAWRLRSHACFLLGAEQEIPPGVCVRRQAAVPPPAVAHSPFRGSNIRSPALHQLFAGGTREAPLRHVCHPIKAERPITRAAQQVLYPNSLAITHVVFDLLSTHGIHGSSACRPESRVRL